MNLAVKIIFSVCLGYVDKTKPRGRRGCGTKILYVSSIKDLMVEGVGFEPTYSEEGGVTVRCH